MNNSSYFLHAGLNPSNFHRFILCGIFSLSSFSQKAVNELFLLAFFFSLFLFIYSRAFPSLFLFLSCLFFSLCEDPWRQCVFQLIYSFSASVETEKKTKFANPLLSEIPPNILKHLLTPIYFIIVNVIDEKAQKVKNKKWVEKIYSRVKKGTNMKKFDITCSFSNLRRARLIKYSEFLSVQCQRGSDRIVLLLNFTLTWI